eukprot:jgi/Tetstr1/456754/TSEL_043451.t1
MSSWLGAELSGRYRAAFEELLEGNGITEDAVAGNAHDITELEMFLFNFPRMVCLDLFSHLTQLTITQQSITKIENLHGCPRLENLWLNENSIEAIEGLEACSQLRRLYLYSNRIRRIEGLEACRALEVLWLADNQIVVVEGLEGLANLRELNLARNQIDQIGDAFSPNANLETLNLADNHVGAFKEICYLARLPRLVDLCFTDPHWGECPLAGLCNYQTYVLFNLQQLTSLDSLALSDETKQLAEATFMKKKMYYNMRIKTLRRNTSNAIRKANQGRTAHVGTSVAVLNLLRRQLKGIEGELAAAAEYEHYSPSSAVRAAASAFEDCKARVHELCNDYVRRMMVELETGGNIRMEDGKPSDLWYSSCVDLVNSRFFPADFVSMGIKGLKVTRVTRIHNRFLRNRFEERLETLVDVSDPTYKRSLEYLFLRGEPSSLTCPVLAGAALPGELLTAARTAFGTPRSTRAMGLDGAVTLSNSISIADSARLASALDGSARRAPGSRSALHGQVLVAKVFLGKCQQESALPASTRAKAPPPISKADFPDCNSVFRVKQTDQKQRLWYVFEHTLVLPEYLVEYEYEATATCALARGAIQQLNARRCSGTSGCPNLATVTYLNLHAVGAAQDRGALAEVPALRTLLLSFNELQKIEGVGDRWRRWSAWTSATTAIRRIEGPSRGSACAQVLELNNTCCSRGASDDSWWRHVEELVVEHKESGPADQPAARVPFMDNELTRLEGLDHSAWRDNDVESLAGIASRCASWSLYIGNIASASSARFWHLKDHTPSLIILDLLGQPAVQEDDYRMYTSTS